MPRLLPIAEVTPWARLNRTQARIVAAPIRTILKITARGLIGIKPFPIGRISLGKTNQPLIGPSLGYQKEGNNMAGRANFSDEEWNLLRLAPLLVASGVSISDPSGLIGTAKEAFYGMSSMMESYKHGAQLELIGALLADKSRPTMPDREALLGEGSRELQFENLQTAILGKVREALALLGTKASPEELAAYRQMLAAVAEETAKASKEGGFLGFGGEQVSAGEQAFLDRVKAALG
jgi:hypothetical protein